MKPSPRFAPALALLALFAIGAVHVSAAEMFVYFGSHRSGPGIGFSLSRFHTDTGVLTKPMLNKPNAPGGRVPPRSTFPAYET